MADVPSAGFGSRSMSAPCAADEERPGLARRRSALRLLGELLLAGVHASTLALLGVMRSLTVFDHGRDPAGAAAALGLLGGLAKALKAQLLGSPGRPPVDLPADALPEVGRA